MIQPRLALAFLFFAGLGARAAETPPPAPALAPALEGKLLGGEPFQLSRLRGKKVILHFFATWCPACQTEIPVLEKAVENSRKNAELILISPESRRSMRELKEFEARHPYKIALIEDLGINTLGRGRILPETLLIDPDGSVKIRFEGRREDLEETLKRWLENTPSRTVFSDTGPSTG